MLNKGNKRFICSFVKENEEGELKPNVVVIPAPNPIMARAVLCEVYGVTNYDIPKEKMSKNDQEGIKKIRLAETNMYEQGDIQSNLDYNSSASDQVSDS